MGEGWRRCRTAADFGFWILDWGSPVDEAEFKRRTKQLSIEVIGLARRVERDIASDAILRQLIRSASSVGANYRAACRAKSLPDIISKLSIVEEEADETMFWLEILAETGTLPRAVVEPLHRETEEILRMTVASIRTLRSRRPNARAEALVPQ